jgi:hypothetical protein
VRRGEERRGEERSRRRRKRSSRDFRESGSFGGCSWEYENEVWWW